MKKNIRNNNYQNSKTRNAAGNKERNYSGKNNGRKNWKPHCVFCGRTAGNGIALIIGTVKRNGSVRRVGICSQCNDELFHAFHYTERAIRNGLIQGPHPELPQENTDSIILSPRTNTSTDSSDENGDDDYVLTPKEIKELLDESVIGQDAAKRALSVAAYNHYKRIYLSCNGETEVQKSNILMAGATGSGKTFLTQTLAGILDVPFVIADATSLTEAGYVGEDVESMLYKLIQAADGNIALAEHGIIYLDEVDKIGRKGMSNRDVSGEGVQQALLKIMEGEEVSVPMQGDGIRAQMGCYTINTKNILFICGGAFEGLDKIVQKRVQESAGKGKIGFLAPGQKEEPVSSPNLIPQDFVQFGLLPEFVGRLPVIVPLTPLDVPMLKRILTEPKNALIRQYQTLFELDNVTLSFDDDALDAIAETAFRQGTGARGLRSIVEKTVEEAMYEIPSDEEITSCTITRETVRGISGAVMERQKER